MHVSLRIAPFILICVIASMALSHFRQDRVFALIDKSDPLQTNFTYFKSRVIPVLENRCAVACHGIKEDDYNALINKGEKSEQFYFPFDLKSGIIPDSKHYLGLLYKNLRNPSHKGGKIEYGEDPSFSTLLRYPLSQEFGGKPHRGIDVFTSDQDPDYQVLHRWIAKENGSIPNKHKPLPEEVRFFKDHVLGVLVRNGCFLPSCHGPETFNELKLIPPLPRTDSARGVTAGFSRSMVLENHKRVLGKTVHHVNLSGDPKLSRLIVKNLPISEGGVHQRGGNTQFFESYEDPDVKTLLDWIKLERRALSSKLRSNSKKIPLDQLGKLRGIAFIRGPLHQPQRFFDPDIFWPSSDIYVLEMGEAPNLDRGLPRNLTGYMDAGKKVHIQAMDVRYDARKIVFSMRTEPSSGFRLYEVELDEELKTLSTPRQVSFESKQKAGDQLIHHLDPIYIPGPKDPSGKHLDDVMIAYASNSGGDFTPSLPWGYPGEPDGGTLDEIVDVQRSEAAGTWNGFRLYFAAGPLAGQWRKIIDHRRDPKSQVGSILKLDRPLPMAPDAHSLYVIESREASVLPGYDIWSFIPGSARARDSFLNTNHQMTYTSSQERRPSMRTNGEVMFSSLRNISYQGDLPVFNTAIYRVHAGGFDYHIQGGNRSRYPIFCDSRELPQGLEVRIALDPRNWTGGGAIMLVDHGLGVGIEPDNPLDFIPFSGDSDFKSASSSPRYLPVQLSLLPETGNKAVTHTGFSPGGSFRDPSPLPDGTILVAHTNQPLDHLDKHSDPNWDLYRVKFKESLQSKDGRSVGPFSLTKVHGASSERWSEIHPRPIMVRRREKSRLKQKFATLPKGIKPSFKSGSLRVDKSTWGEVQCYDYPLLESFLTTFAPMGEKIFRSIGQGTPGRVGRKRGALKYVRILKQQPLREVPSPVANANDDPFSTVLGLGIHTPKEIVTEIPLEQDGSFYAQVPSKVPLIMQGLDENRMAVHSMNRWFYVHPGEKLTFSIPRSIFPLRCSGCHGALTGKGSDGGGAPDLVSAGSRVMATWDPVLGTQRLPSNSQKNTSLRIDYRKDIQPLLAQKCVSCHGTKNPAAGLSLVGWPTKHFTVSYENLHQLADPNSPNQSAKLYINERESLSSESYLMEILSGEELMAEGVLKKPGVRHPEGNPLSHDQILVFARWIDLGAAFSDGAEGRLP
ncbi:hypothetical protein HOF92_12555 [bacterium]|nr:hypothetical protein [bacterium]